MNHPLFCIGLAVLFVSCLVPYRRPHDMVSKVLFASACFIILLAFIPRAKAADVMEIPGVAVLTDERGQCPRNHAIAKFPDLTRGCWTIGEHDRITRIYRGRKLVAEYSSVRLEIYGRLVR